MFFNRARCCVMRVRAPDEPHREGIDAYDFDLSDSFDERVTREIEARLATLTAESA